MEIRKEERKDWTRAGQNRGTSQDLKVVSEALSYLRQKGLSTVEDLEVFLESSGKSAADYRSQMKPKEARSNAALIVGGAVLCSGKRKRPSCRMVRTEGRRETGDGAVREAGKLCTAVRTGGLSDLVKTLTDTGKRRTKRRNRCARSARGRRTWMPWPARRRGRRRNPRACSNRTDRFPPGWGPSKLFSIVMVSRPSCQLLCRVTKRSPCFMRAQASAAFSSRLANTTHRSLSGAPQAGTERRAVNDAPWRRQAAE